MVTSALRIGTAGWAIPREVAQAFPPGGSSLERYASRFAAAEINSSFHRPHRPSTYARWAASVPDAFRFSVKLPKTVTHVRKLADAEDDVGRFLDEISPLGPKLGPLLVQLPPSLTFKGEVAETFFRALRSRHAGHLVCEPRHPSWFDVEADRLLLGWQVARVAADPPPVGAAAEPGGWTGLVYVRLHGSPRMYRSAYDEPFLDALAARNAAATVETWCMFDNTASGAACANALALLDRLERGR